MLQWLVPIATDAFLPAFGLPRRGLSQTARGPCSSRAYVPAGAGQMALSCTANPWLGFHGHLPTQAQETVVQPFLAGSMVESAHRSS